MEIPPEDRPPEGVNKLGLTTRGGVPPHSRYCHKCQFNGRTDATAQRACIACPGAPDAMPRKGETFVSFDGAAGKTPDKNERGLYNFLSEKVKRLYALSPVADDATITAGELRRIFYTLAELDKRAILMLHALLQGKSLADGARYADVARQIGYKAARDALEKMPLLAALFPARSRKHALKDFTGNVPATKTERGTDMPDTAETTETKQTAHKVTVTLDEAALAKVAMLANFTGRTVADVTNAAINAALHAYAIDETLFRF